MFRRAIFATALVLIGCTRNQTPADDGQGIAASATTVLTTVPVAARVQRGASFARLPDRGELMAFPTGTSRQSGAYTWRRAEFSEEHALRAIAGGQMRVVTPSGETLDIRYERHIEHPSGDWTWIGHLAGDPGAQTIVTFGAKAVYGSIAQANKRPLRLTSRGGVGWLVETDPAKLAGMVSEAINPTKPDHLAVPSAILASKRGAAQRQSLSAPGSGLAATAAASATVDVLIGYTQGYVTAQGSTSAALTRLNYLVDTTNAAYANSQVDMRVRLVHSMQVNYGDSSSNGDALEELTGYNTDSQSKTTPNAAFNALRAAREQHGADLVALVRPFRDPEQEGCGIAWLIGGGKSGVSTGDGQDYFGYSVVSDGSDDDSYCRDESFAHELGHNLGSAHDRDTAQGDDGKLDNPDDYGAFTYSFGYKTAASGGNFYTIMAYGDQGQTSYRVFSNPRITFCGGRACGATTYEDNARSLGQVMPVVSQFRAASTPSESQQTRNDVDGDARSDLLWVNPSSSQFAYWIMNGASTVRTKTFSVSSGYRIAATGDLNGDGEVDLLWTSSARDLYLWTGNGNSFTSTRLTSYSSGWNLEGAGDVNGDGKADLIWSNPGARLFAYWIMDGSAIVRTKTSGVTANYTIGAIGDFNSDGLVDLVWTSSARDLYLFTGNGSGFTSNFIGNYDSGWKIAGAGDIDADGKSDLLWSNAAADRFGYWIMNGATINRIETFAISDGYSIASSGDLNGDGRIDLLWTSAARDLYLWTGNGNSFAGTRLSSYGSGWSMVNVKAFP